MRDEGWMGGVSVISRGRGTQGGVRRAGRGGAGGKAGLCTVQQSRKSQHNRVITLADAPIFIVMTISLPSPREAEGAPRRRGCPLSESVCWGGYPLRSLPPAPSPSPLSNSSKGPECQAVFRMRAKLPEPTEELSEMLL